MNFHKFLLISISIAAIIVFAYIFFIKPPANDSFKSPKFDVSVGQQGDTINTAVQSAGSAISFSIPAKGAKMSKIGEKTVYKLSGNTALVYEIKKDGLKPGLKETIVLGSSAAPTEYTFNLKLDNIDSFNPDPEKRDWHFFDKDKKEVFKIPAGFMVDNTGTKSNLVNIGITKKGADYTLKVTADKKWLSDPARVYPIQIDPSVIVSGTIAETEAQFGGNQRKIIYALDNFGSGTWYAFYTDGSDVFYKKSSDGVTWGSAVDMDTSDADNVNPSAFGLGQPTDIYVTWIDTGSNVLEVNKICTSCGDALGTKCSSPSPGTLGTTYTVSIAVTTAHTVYLAVTDTGAGTTTAIYKLAFSGCTFTDISTTTGTETLRPNGAGDATLITYQTPASTFHWDKVDEAVADDTTTQVYDTANTYDLYTLADTGLTTETINSVDVISKTAVSGGGAGGGFTKAGVHITGQTDVYGATRTNSAWTTYTETAIAKPGGGSWAVSDLNGLQTAAQVNGDYICGKGCTTYSSGFTQIYVNVNYTRSILSAGSKPVLVLAGGGGTLHVIYQDGNLSDSTYNGTSWTTTNTTIDSVADTTYSVTTDGTNVWVLSVSGTTATNFYKYNGSTWSTLTAPWTGQTNLTSASVTYDSTNSDLYAAVIMGASEQAYYKSSDAATIAWSPQASFGFTAGDLGHLSLPLTITSGTQLAIMLRQGTNLEFSFGTANPSVIVSGGITETEAQFGGNQRKVAFVNGNWYAFYTDATDVWYRKSSDGAAWGNAVDVDNTDADNLNPSIYVSGNSIYVTWIDTGSNVLEVNTINTASSDAQGTKCSSPSPGTLGSTYMTSIAVADNGTVYVATTDTGAGTVEAIYKLVFSGCTFTNLESYTETLRPNSGTYSSELGDNNDATSITAEGAGCCLSTTVDLQDTAISGSAVINSITLSHRAWQSDPYNEGLSYNGHAYTHLIRSGNTGATLSGTGADTPQTFNYASYPRPGAGTWVVGDLNGLTLYAEIEGAHTIQLTDMSDTWITVYYSLSYIPAGSKPTLVTTGNTLHVIFQDGNLSHSVYDGSNWTTDNTTIDAVTASKYSVTTDGTNVWVLTVHGEASSVLYKYNGSTWSTLTMPWTGQTNLTSATITYDSTNSDLYAMVIKDASEQAYYKSTDASTISWGSESSFGFTPGDLGHISSPLSGAGTSQIGVTVRQGANFEFAKVSSGPASPTPTPLLNIRSGNKFRGGAKFQP